MRGGEEARPSLDSPTLPPVPTQRTASGSNREESGKLFFPFSCWNDVAILSEIKRQLWLAGPLIAVNFLQYCVQVISILFVGHLGELSLSGASMATSFANVTGFSLLLGMGSALDTFCGQAYGAKQYHMLGIHMQRAMFVLLLVCIPLAFVWAYTAQILMAVRQNPEISFETGVYARWLIPGLFAMVCFNAMSVYNSGLGNKGASLATSISYWINVVQLAVYVKFSHACKETWSGLSKEALHDVLKFLRLAVPSAFMICLEYWAFEMVVLLSGLLPNPKLETSVLSISLNTMWMVYMIPTGLGSAASIRVSNELGGGQPQAARLAVRAVLIIAITEGLVVFLITILVRDLWGALYSNEAEVVKYVSIMMPVLATSDFLVEYNVHFQVLQEDVVGKRSVLLLILELIMLLVFLRLLSLLSSCILVARDFGWASYVH